MSSNKWKDALLKTSLPLEFLVADKLSKLGFDVSEEFVFVRRNEQNIDTEFSVDLGASRPLFRGEYEEWGQISFLIECKYNYPSVKWVFAPHPMQSRWLTEVITVFDHLSTKRLIPDERMPVPYFDTRHLFNEPLQVCMKGIELHESDANTQSITRGVHQLRWATPNLVCDILKNKMSVIDMGWSNVAFICPILVTTASLHVMKNGLTLINFQDASKLDEITDKVEALMVKQEPSSQMIEHIQKLVDDLHGWYPETKEVFESIAKGKIRAEFLSSHSRFIVDSFMRTASSRVLVITLDAFEKIITKLCSAINDTEKDLKQVAVVRTNKRKGKIWFEPVGRGRALR